MEALAIISLRRAPLAEDISRALLVLIGAWFILRAARGHAHHPKQEGIAVGFIAGLIPCPLTLFVMVTAQARAVPLAGLMFAASMFLGIALTLGAVAALAIFGRDAATSVLTRHGASIVAVGRLLDGVAGVLLVGFGLRELLR